jgi:hypothetical protein
VDIAPESTERNCGRAPGDASPDDPDRAPADSRQLPLRATTSRVRTTAWRLESGQRDHTGLGVVADRYGTLMADNQRETIMPGKTITIRSTEGGEFDCFLATPAGGD